jgi:hypothetical protein
MRVLRLDKLDMCYSIRLNIIKKVYTGLGIKSGVMVDCSYFYYYP